MNKFYNFLESIENHDENLVGSIKEAYKLIFEGLSTEEAVNDAYMKLEVNTEEKETEKSPESDEISYEDIRIDGLDELIEEN